MAQFHSFQVFAWTSIFVFLVFFELSHTSETSEFPSDPKLEDIVQKRLLVTFNPLCSHIDASKRALLAALETRRVEENGPANFDVRPVSDGDFPAYTRTLFLKTPRDGIPIDRTSFEMCTVFQTDLTHAGVSIISLSACPELDVGLLKNSFEEDSCITEVDVDSIMFINEVPPLQGLASVKEKIEESTEYSKESYMPVTLETANKSDLSNEEFTYWIDIIGAPKAWKISKCKPSVVVGVIDTGVDVMHPNLRPNIWVNPGEIPNNGIDDDNNGFVDDVNGYDFFSHTGAVTDPHSHGTHCAGIIGASSPGADTGNGISGVCQHVSIAGLRFMSPTGSGATSSAIEALNYAAQMKFALTSNSWGSSSPASMLEIAIRNVNELGQIFIAAAGNDGRNTDYNSHYPSSYSLSNIVSVAATDSKDTLASFSNYGTRTVHIAAPGVQIWSTYPGGQLKYLSGTSMATPVIAGVVAMILSVCKLKPIDVRKLLMRTADEISKLNGRVASGGRVNAFKALMELDPDNCQDTES